MYNLQTYKPKPLTWQHYTTLDKGPQVAEEDRDEGPKVVEEDKSKGREVKVTKEDRGEGPYVHG